MQGVDNKRRKQDEWETNYGSDEESYEGSHEGSSTNFESVEIRDIDGHWLRK